MTDPDTIVAPATPAGRGGIAVVRLSGPATTHIATALLGRVPAPRHAQFAPFLGADGAPLDRGIALFFPAPCSFTGEDVLELHGHGGPVVVDMLIARVLELGARLARPGEFSERAFLNGKIDLVQAEAIADLIDSASQAAVRAAMQSMSGAFSARVNEIVEAVVALRTQVEANIDFADEDIEVIEDAQMRAALADIARRLAALLDAGRQGYLINAGLRVVLLGAPNVGKSSLLNCLSESQRAIVDTAPGTTRDVIEQSIHIAGLPVSLLDTAGLRDTGNRVESEGVRRARRAVAEADHCLWVCDDTQESDDGQDAPISLPDAVAVTVVRNKIDLSGRPPGEIGARHPVEIAVSAATGAGIPTLKARLAQAAGVRPAAETGFIARRRHVDALERAQQRVQEAAGLFPQTLELVAEELRLAQQSLSEITGTFTSEDLLERIFASFCIGK